MVSQPTIDILDPNDTPEAGIFQADKDMAFRIHGVPEPTSVAMAAFGLFSLGLVRRKRG